MIYVLDNVTKVFPRQRTRISALTGITLEVPRGTQLAVLGQSGAGKTTLFRLLNATARPTSGLLQFEGRDVASMSGANIRAMRRRIGTIYQQHNLVPSLSALENTLCGSLGQWSLAKTLRNIVRPVKSDLDRALHALEIVGLADQRHARADELSGGQQQRVAIARVLMQDPDAILADEPIASLDPALADGILSLLARLASEGKRTLLISLHRAGLALHYFPRVLALKAGCVSFDGPASSVSRDLLSHLYSDGETNKAQHGSYFQPEPGCLR